MSNLPTLQELVKNVDTYKEQDKLNFLLNQEPPVKWISKHPFIKKEIEIKLENGKKLKRKVPYEYLPIDKVEYLLRKIFKEYRIEILREGTSFNGVYVAVRLHYKNLASNEWSYHDGIGAIQLQVKSGSSPSDLANINNGALSMAFPLAKTLAIKDAADMFGKLFGADLNRIDTLPASMDKPILTTEEKEKELQNILSTKKLDIEDRLNIGRILDQKEVLSYDKIIKKFK